MHFPQMRVSQFIVLIKPPELSLRESSSNRINWAERSGIMRCLVFTKLGVEHRISVLPAFAFVFVNSHSCGNSKTFHRRKCSTIVISVRNSCQFRETRTRSPPNIPGTQSTILGELAIDRHTRLARRSVRTVIKHSVKHVIRMLGIIQRYLTLDDSRQSLYITVAESSLRSKKAYMAT